MANVTMKISNAKKELAVYVDLNDFFDAEVFIDGIRNGHLTYYASTLLKVLSEMVDHETQEQKN